MNYEITRISLSHSDDDYTIATGRFVVTEETSGRPIELLEVDLQAGIPLRSSYAEAEKALHEEFKKFSDKLAQAARV